VTIARDPLGKAGELRLRQPPFGARFGNAGTRGETGTVETFGGVERRLQPVDVARGDGAAFLCRAQVYNRALFQRSG
jgi:hypothetical protein